MPTSPICYPLTRPAPGIVPLHHTADRQDLIDDIHRELGYAPPFLPTLLTETEIAKVFKRTPATLRNRRWLGLPMPPFTRIGRNAMYRAEDVADYLLASWQDGIR